MSDDGVTIFHNPACGTSRSVLAMIEEAGHTPTVIDYLKTGWEEAQLRGLLAEAGLTPREALRTKSDLAGELGLLADGVSDEAVFAAMLAHPVLVERPLVKSPKGVVLARPKERLLHIL